DSGPCGVEPTTIVDLTNEIPMLVRSGKGDPELFGLERTA
ncbi:MAG: threonylcarbamoyl-AMP synthase, partial [Betaproteobacteria bacterium]